MITQIVLFKLKDRSEAVLNETHQVLMSMNGKIEGLNHLEVQTDILRGPISYDIVLMERFESRKALEAYLIHPVHVEVAKYMDTVAESAAAVDFES